MKNKESKNFKQMLALLCYSIANINSQCTGPQGAKIVKDPNAEKNAKLVKELVKEVKELKDENAILAETQKNGSNINTLKTKEEIEKIAKKQEVEAGNLAIRINRTNEDVKEKVEKLGETVEEKVKNAEEVFENKLNKGVEQLDKKAANIEKSLEEGVEKLEEEAKKNKEEAEKNLKTLNTTLEAKANELTKILSDPDEQKKKQKETADKKKAQRKEEREKKIDTLVKDTFVDVVGTNKGKLDKKMLKNAADKDDAEKFIGSLIKKFSDFDKLEAFFKEKIKDKFVDKDQKDMMKDIFTKFIEEAKGVSTYLKKKYVREDFETKKNKTNKINSINFFKDHQDLIDKMKINLTIPTFSGSNINMTIINKQILAYIEALNYKIIEEWYPNWLAEFNTELEVLDFSSEVEEKYKKMQKALLEAIKTKPSSAFKQQLEDTWKVAFP